MPTSVPTERATHAAKRLLEEGAVAAALWWPSMSLRMRLLPIVNNKKYRVQELLCFERRQELDRSRAPAMIRLD